jgi:hypothetical protein
LVVLLVFVGLVFVQYPLCTAANCISVCARWLG